MDTHEEIARKARLHGWWVGRTIVELLGDVAMAAQQAEMTLDEYRAWRAEQKQRPAPRDDREHQEQAALFQWAATVESRLPELRLLFAIPNGGDRHPAVAAKLKAEGVKSGVPDLCLPVPHGAYHALWIELKAPGGRVSTEQAAWIDALILQDHLAVVCVGWMAAARWLVSYLGHNPGDHGL